ncbi:Ceramide glucosyltransferase [Tieghemiomyces parasiticus]|uniref:Ceramide glucosyltransferase n=1 Tax=Tieghemiomyces parasiticus TaxID=78921 RepID=A0A9W8AC49_9FUNG|nr:Ceramide glucosyltransferase [Tieghemiomyces parasiticus]
MADPSPDFSGWSPSSGPLSTGGLVAAPTFSPWNLHDLPYALLHRSPFASTTVRDAVAIFGIFWWCVMVMFCVSGLWVTKWRYHPPRVEPSSHEWPKRRPEDVPGVSIIRPLKGVDPDLDRNLRSSFEQDYPRLEIIFTAEDGDDPAIPVARALIAEYAPRIAGRVVVSTQRVGFNPKINNIIDGFESCQYEILWMCDSNVYSDSGCLSRSVDQLERTSRPVGIVHHLIYAAQPVGFGAWLETMFINTVHAKMYLAINASGAASCVVGKSNVYYKRHLDALGGLKPFSSYMAEDNTIAQAFWKRGWKHRMTSDLATQSLGRMTLADYFTRRMRWTRTRKYNVTFATVVEPVTESLMCGLLAAFSFHHFYGVPPLPFFGAHLLAWFVCDLQIFRCLAQGQLPCSFAYWAWVWICRELFALPLYIYAVVGNRVSWRGRQFKLSLQGTITPVDGKVDIET